MTGCTARIRPLVGDTELVCEEGAAPHNPHAGILRDYAFAGSETRITWFESDRRCFHGEWPGRCDEGVCVLPAGHRGNHAS